MTNAAAFTEEGTPILSGDERVALENQKSNNSTAFLERIAHENRLFAEKLNKAKWIFALYGLVDGVSNSYSIIKHAFDTKYSFEDLDPRVNVSDVMHNWMLTDAGIAVTVLEALSVVTLSLMANVWDDDDKNKFKRYVAILWPYARDTLKSLKNTYKGLNNTLKVVAKLGGTIPGGLTIPIIGVVLGVLLVLNRFYMRTYVREPRKKKMRENKDLWLEITSKCRLFIENALPEDIKNFANSYIFINDELYYIKPDLTKELVEIIDLEVFKRNLDRLKNRLENQKVFYLSDGITEDLITKNSKSEHTPTRRFDEKTCQSFQARVGTQEESLRHKALLSAMFNGIMDGLYLYMGVIMLSGGLLSFPALVAVTVFSAIFVATCIATRIYEEYIFQRQLEETEAKVALALCARELEEIYCRMADDHEKILLDKSLTEVQKRKKWQEKQPEFEAEFQLKFKEFNRKKEKLQSVTVSSHKLAAIAGLSNGLYGYGVIASCLFAVVTVTTLFYMPFLPAPVVIIGVALGLCCLIGFLAHSLITNYQNRSKLSKQHPVQNELAELFEKVKASQNAVRDLRPNFQAQIYKEMVTDDGAPLSDFMQAAEVARSAMSATGKGEKSVVLMLNSMQEKGTDGHYHDSQPMFWFTAISAAFFTFVLTTRAYARGFGRKDAKEIITRQGEYSPLPLPLVSPSTTAPVPMAVQQSPDGLPPPRRGSDSQPPASSAFIPPGTVVPSSPAQEEGGGGGTLSSAGDAGVNALDASLPPASAFVPPGTVVSSSPAQRGAGGGTMPPLSLAEAEDAGGDLLNTSLDSLDQGGDAGGHGDDIDSHPGDSPRLPHHPPEGSPSPVPRVGGVRGTLFAVNPAAITRSGSAPVLGVDPSGRGLSPSALAVAVDGVTVAGRAPGSV
jgi:uncharacterized membrane protein